MFGRFIRKNAHRYVVYRYYPEWAIPPSCTDPDTCPHKRGTNFSDIAQGRRQMRFHYKLRNSQLLDHLECMIASCEIFVGVVRSSLPAPLNITDCIEDEMGG